ncbi:MAG: heat-inducible transcriptional repressor HrcA [Mariprofundaceae bacterium]|nr:heat-inducible transcriptional repressor HrcA [Mariprofundaceae bacterium]
MRQHTKHDLNERHGLILGEVVRAYLGHGQPVGSRTVAEQGGLALSPASIRNVMAELEQQGLLSSPHTSAGRVPTDHGLRYFVDSLMMTDSNIERDMEAVLSGHLNVEDSQPDLLRRATDELASLSSYAGLVWVHEIGVQRMRRIELMGMSSEKVLAVIVTSGDEVQNRLIHRPDGLDDRALPEISRKLNELLVDCDLGEVCRRLQREMEQDRLHVRRLIEGLKRWAEAPTQGQDDMFVSGQRQLLEMPEFGVIDTVKSLLKAFDEKEQLLHLMEQVEKDEQGVRVFIGGEHAMADMEQVSMVMARYKGPKNTVGTLGVIGPKRMRYDRVLPIVDCTARLVSRILGGKD